MMSLRKFCWCMAMLMLAAGSTFAEDQPAQLLGDPAGARFMGSDSAGSSRMQGDVREIESLAAGHWYDVQLACPVSSAWKPGDTLVVNMEVRTTQTADESGEGWIMFALQQNGPPFAKAFRFERSVPQQWIKLQYPFKVGREVDPAKAMFIVGIGNRKQKIEIRSLSLRNFGPVPVSSIPATKITYEGREPDAAWRAEAANRIEQIRMTDLPIRVVDASGKPAPGATVKIEQTRHAFAFGSEVGAEALLADSPDARKYQQIVEQNFNRVVLGNDLKWWSWVEHRQRALDALRWLHQRNIEVRGHVLVWPSHRHMYKTEQFAHDPAGLAKYIDDHITDEVTATHGLLVNWDVINEPYDNHDAMDILGRDAMVGWFKLARQFDPDVQLYINDFGILSGGGADAGHQNHYEQTIRYLIDQGAPLDGIGLQSHFMSTLTPPERVWSVLNRFAAFGKKLQITELDVDVDSPELQADYMRDFLTICFSHPQVDGIVMWGFWAGRHWRPNAALYNKDWTLKPVGQAWRDMVFGKWWTKIEAKTDGAGKLNPRVFKGDYRITAESPSGKASADVSTAKRDAGGITLTLQP